MQTYRHSCQFPVTTEVRPVGALRLLNLWYRPNTWPMFKSFGIVQRDRMPSK